MSNKLITETTFTVSNMRDFIECYNDNVVITAAQNNTEVHLDALVELEKYCIKVGAELVVLPIKYNKRAFSSAVEDSQENFAAEITPYLQCKPFLLDDINVYSNCHILPTAKYPVNAGADLNGGERCTIVASPKMQQKELPRGEGQERSTIFTTGAITVPNYLESRAGSVAQKSHKIAALHIVDGNVYPIEYDESLKWEYDFESLVVGDVHSENIDYKMLINTIKLIETHKIKNVVLHDLLDFKSRNGHERNSGKHLFLNQDSCVKGDLLKVAHILQQFRDICPHVYVVRSNHDDMLDRWLEDFTYRPHLDPMNAVTYYGLQYKKYLELEAGNEPNMLEIALKHPDLRIKGEINFLKLRDSLLLAGNQVANHGHKGTNGARSGLQKLNVPMVVGHSHSGQRLDDFVTVGTISTLQQGYNAGGGSSWTNHNALICKSGRVVLIDMD